jgi:hypothetical protein
MEKPGLMESGFPVQTVPMMARMRARSTPIPYTLAISICDVRRAYKLTLVDRSNDLAELNE